MSLATPVVESAPLANEVWDLARLCRTTVWHISPSETVSWPVEGGKSLTPRSYRLVGPYYMTPEGIGIKRRYWHGRRHLSVIGRQAFESTVKSSLLLELKAELERRRTEDFNSYQRDTLRKPQDKTVELLGA